jgi:hypothetical protein
MKHLSGDTSADNQQRATAFVLAAFEKKQLAEQIEDLYESVNSLGANLDVESRQKLFENTSEYMKKLGARLVEIEQDLNRMLPDFLAFSASPEDISTAELKTDNTMPFATGDVGTGSESVLPKPLVLSKIAPEKPTLIAMEPAPMVDEEDGAYEFEDDEEFELQPEPEVFETPAPPLTPSRAAGADYISAENNPEAAAESVDRTPIDIRDESRLRDSETDITEPVVLRDDVEKEIPVPEALPTKHSADNSWDPPSAESFIAKQTMRYGTEVDPSNQPAPSAELAAILEPELPPDEAPTPSTAESPENPADNANPDTQENVNERPTLDADPCVAPSDKDARILFWKQSAMNIAEEGESPISQPNMDSYAPGVWPDQLYTLSRIPSLLPRDAIPDAPSSQLPANEQEEMDSASSSKAQPEFSSAADTSDTDDNDCTDAHFRDAPGDADERCADSYGPNPLEEELYQMLDIHSPLPEDGLEAHKQHKQTLVGIAAFAENDMDDIAPPEEIKDPSSSEENQQ